MIISSKFKYLDVYNKIREKYGGDRAITFKSFYDGYASFNMFMSRSGFHCLLCLDDNTLTGDDEPCFVVSCFKHDRMNVRVYPMTFVAYDKFNRSCFLNRFIDDFSELVK